MRLNAPTCVAVSGLCILILGFLCSSLIFPKLENHLIAKETALEEGSKAFKSWKKIPFPFKFKIYFFNVTNPDEVQDGSNPVLKELGPYIYEYVEFRKREILSTNEENDTITYIQRKIYYFNQEESGCRSQDDIVTILNFGIVSTAHKVNEIAPSVLSMVNDGLPFLYPGIKNAFTTNSVRNILFDGLPMSCESEVVDMICQGLRSKMPPTVRAAENNRDYLVSLFHHVGTIIILFVRANLRFQINGSDDGPYEIARGFKSTTKGKMVSFKNKTALSEWGGDYCNKIRGTDLTVNPNLLTIPKRIHFFASDFCRSFSAGFNKKMEYLGLHTYKFTANDIFRSDEDCFCASEADDDSDLPSCPPAGTMHTGPCTESHIIISQPHFLNAEKSLLTYAKGLKPNKDKHGTYIIMEPKTGLALVVKTRFQMNIFLQRFDAVDLLRNVSEGLFPFIWLEEGAVVPLPIVEEIRNNFSKLKIFDILKYIMIISGIVLLGVSLILAMIKDNIFCVCANHNVGKNVVSVSELEPREKFADLYPHLKMKNVTLVNNKTVDRQAWKILE
ncbi:sensory neuron membrane protein 2-like [Asbolus verrucosus]|uniref:Sensory neuron membrane protein 2-like n=1 Tax=Asbolus verrucosus TaxID=1661398 RepID=A0A482VZ11_ASBVE|nr:sensory neuron membrane protein 2-like [Asbolus verrucosus]